MRTLDLPSIISDASDRISLNGRAGMSWGELTTLLSINSIKLSIYIAKKLLISGQFTFICRLHRIIDQSELENIIFKESMDVLVIASMNLIWQSLGIQQCSEIPTEQALLVLEYIASSREKGRLIPEISKELNIKLVHPFIDKITSLGLVIKRMVNCTAKSPQSRINTRTNILHLKRFAPLYIPAIDNLKFEADDTIKDCISNIMAEKLLKRKINFMRADIMSKILNIGYRSMTLFRAIHTSYQKYSASPIKFFLQECSIYVKRTREEQIKQVWCVGLNENFKKNENNYNDIDNNNNNTSNTNTNRKRLIGQSVTMNAPLYQQAMNLLNDNKEGLVSNSFGFAFGLYKKRLGNLVIDLAKIYSLPFIKSQEGRQQAYRLFPPPTPPPWSGRVNTVSASITTPTIQVSSTATATSTTPLVQSSSDTNVSDPDPTMMMMVMEGDTSEPLSISPPEIIAETLPETETVSVAKGRKRKLPAPAIEKSKKTTATATGTATGTGKQTKRHKKDKDTVTNTVPVSVSVSVTNSDIDIDSALPSSSDNSILLLRTTTTISSTTLTTTGNDARQDTITCTSSTTATSTATASSSVIDLNSTEISLPSLSPSLSSSLSSSMEVDNTKISTQSHTQSQGLPLSLIKGESSSASSSAMKRRSSSSSSSVKRKRSSRVYFKVSSSVSLLTSVHEKRAQFILNVIDENDGVISTFDILRKLHDMEEASGNIYQADRRTIAKIINTLVAAGLLKKATALLPTGYTIHGIQQVPLVLSVAALGSSNSNSNVGGDSSNDYYSMKIASKVRGFVGNVILEREKHRLDKEKFRSKGSDESPSTSTSTDKSLTSRVRMGFVDSNVAATVKRKRTRKHSTQKGGRKRGTLRILEIEKKLDIAEGGRLYTLLLSVRPHGLCLGARELHLGILLTLLGPTATICPKRTTSPVSLMEIVYSTPIRRLLKICGLPSGLERRIFQTYSGAYGGIDEGELFKDKKGLSANDTLFLQFYSNASITLRSIASSNILSSTSTSSSTSRSQNTFVFRETMSYYTNKLRVHIMFLMSIGIIQPQEGSFGRSCSSSVSNSNMTIEEQLKNNNLNEVKRQKEVNEIDAMRVRTTCAKTVCNEMDLMDINSDIWQRLEIVWKPPGAQTFVWTESDVWFYWTFFVVPALKNCEPPSRNTNTTTTTCTSANTNTSTSIKGEQQLQHTRSIDNGNGKKDQKKAIGLIVEYEVPLICRSLAAAYQDQSHDSNGHSNGSGGKLTRDDFLPYKIVKDASKIIRKIMNQIHMEKTTTTAGVESQYRNNESRNSAAAAKDRDTGDVSLLALFLQQCLKRIITGTCTGSGIGNPSSSNTEDMSKELQLQLQHQYWNDLPLLHFNFNILELDSSSGIAFETKLKTLHKRNRNVGILRKRLALLAHLIASRSMDNLLQSYPTLEPYITSFLRSRKLSSQISTDLSLSSVSKTLPRLLLEGVFTKVIQAYGIQNISNREQAIQTLSVFPLQLVTRAHQELVHNGWLARMPRKDINVDVEGNKKHRPMGYELTRALWTELKGPLAVTYSKLIHRNKLGSFAPSSQLNNSFAIDSNFMQSSSSSTGTSGVITEGEDEEARFDALYLAHMLAGDRLVGHISLSPMIIEEEKKADKETEKEADKDTATATATAVVGTPDEEDTTTTSNSTNNNNNNTAAEEDIIQFTIATPLFRRKDNDNDNDNGDGSGGHCFRPLLAQVGHLRKPLNRLNGFIGFTVPVLTPVTPDTDIVTDINVLVAAAAAVSETDMTTSTLSLPSGTTTTTTTIDGGDTTMACASTGEDVDPPGDNSLLVDVASIVLHRVCKAGPSGIRFETLCSYIQQQQQPRSQTKSKSNQSKRKKNSNQSYANDANSHDNSGNGLNAGDISSSSPMSLSLSLSLSNSLVVTRVKQVVIEAILNQQIAHILPNEGDRPHSLHSADTKQLLQQEGVVEEDKEDQEGRRSSIEKELTPTTLLVNKTFEYLYNTHPQTEIECPWMNFKGEKNLQIYDTFRAKVLAILTTKPGCHIDILHAALPLLTHEQLKYFLEGCLYKEGYITWKDINIIIETYANSNEDFFTCIDVCTLKSKLFEKNNKSMNDSNSGNENGVKNKCRRCYFMNENGWLS
eukprot:gene1905-3686_t